MKKYFEIVEFLKSKDLFVKMHGAKENLEIRNLSYDNREDQNKSLFFCKGKAFNVKYLISAIDKGSIAYISEIKYDVDAPCIIVSDIRKAMLEVAKFFYDYPDKKLKIIGVSGTKGKSTTVMMIKKALDEILNAQSEKKCGLISTISTYDGVSEYKSKLTTPEALALYRNLYNCVNSGIKYAIVEISSQALKYERVGDLECDIVCLLNIGRDHIGDGEHKSVEDYVLSKLKLFNLSSEAVICTDTEHIDEIMETARAKGVKVYTCSIQDSGADFCASDISSNSGTTTYRYKDKEYKLNLFGKYNVANAIVAMAAIKRLGFSEEMALEKITDVYVPGRSIIFATGDKNVVTLIDYAHNYLSFTNALEEIKNRFEGYEIFSIFGASGDKAPNRKKDLVDAASIYSDRIYIVPDDPGSKSMKEIADEMIAYITRDVYATYFEVRSECIEAIFDELKQTKKKTVLFIAGKGDESYQIIKGEYLPIENDIDVAKRLVGEYDLVNS